MLRFIRWPVIRLAAGRLTLRDDRPGPAVMRLLYGSALTVAACVALIAAGVHHLLIVGVLAVASMLLVAGICLRILAPAMAVSVVGIALSCASLMTALSVTDGFTLEITRAMARLNGHVLLTKYGLDFFEYEDVADRFLDDPRVTAASPFAYSMVAAVAVHGDAASDAAAQDALEVGAASDESEQEASEEGPGPAIVVGKGLDPDRAKDLDGLADILEGGDLAALRPGGRQRPGAVLGVGLARRLNLEVGDRMRLVVPAELDGSGRADGGPPRYAEFDVLDLLRTGTAEYDRNLVLVHITAAQALFFREGRVTGIEFELTDPALAAEVARDMHEELGDFYRTSTWEETNASLLVGLAQIRITLSIVLGLMVLTASSSLLASLLLLVRRKRHDIAVLLALGSDRSLLFWMFEMVGVFAGMLGAGLGLGLGGLYCAVIEAYRYPLVGDVYPVDHLPVVVGLGGTLVPALAAVFLCAAATGPVAALAARVGIIDALRK